MAWDNPNVLPNVIPHDENGNPVAVLYYYDEAAKKYFPIETDAGKQLIAIGPRVNDFELMHEAITVADTVVPTTPLELFDFSNYSNITVDIKLEGVNPYVTLLPLYWNPVTGMYHEGQSEKFLTSCRVYADAGCSDMYLLPIEVQGTVTVAVSGA